MLYRLRLALILLGCVSAPAFSQTLVCPPGESVCYDDWFRGRIPGSTPPFDNTPLPLGSKLNVGEQFLLPLVDPRPDLVVPIGFVLPVGSDSVALVGVTLQGGRILNFNVGSTQALKLYDAKLYSGSIEGVFGRCDSLNSLTGVVGSNCTGGNISLRGTTEITGNIPTLTIPGLFPISDPEPAPVGSPLTISGSPFDASRHIVTNDGILNFTGVNPTTSTGLEIRGNASLVNNGTINFQQNIFGFGVYVINEQFESVATDGIPAGLINRGAVFARAGQSRFNTPVTTDGGTYEVENTFLSFERTGLHINGRFTDSSFCVRGQTCFDPYGIGFSGGGHDFVGTNVFDGNGAVRFAGFGPAGSPENTSRLRAEAPEAFGSASPLGPVRPATTARLENSIRLSLGEDYTLDLGSGELVNTGVIELENGARLTGGIAGAARPRFDNTGSFIGRIAANDPGDPTLRRIDVINGGGGTLQFRPDDVAFATTNDVGVLENRGDSMRIATRTVMMGSLPLPVPNTVNATEFTQAADPNCASNGVSCAPTLTLDPGAILDVAGLFATSAGLVDVQAGATLDAGEFLQTGGTTRVNGTIRGGRVRLDGGVLTGAGLITYDPFVPGSSSSIALNGVTVKPGNSPGSLTIDGDLTGENLTFDLEIGGTDPGLFDAINVTGFTSLTGTTTFNLIFVDDYVPTPGQVFSGFINSAFGISGLENSVFNFLSDDAIINGAFNSFFGGVVIGSVEQPNVVPLPAGLWLLGSAVGSLYLARRRRPASAQAT